MRNDAHLTALVIGGGAINALVLLLVVFGLVAVFGAVRPGPAGSGPLLAGESRTAQDGSHSVATAAGNTVEALRTRATPRALWSLLFETTEPYPGGLYACETCRGYPSGAHYARDSYRWQDRF